MKFESNTSSYKAKRSFRALLCALCLVLMWIVLLVLLILVRIGQGGRIPIDYIVNATGLINSSFLILYK